MFEVDVLIPFHRDPDRNLYEAIQSASNSYGIRPNIFLVDDRIHKTKFDLPQVAGRIKVIDNHIHGYASALTTGFSYCNSKYIALINSDDLQDKKRIFSQILGMRKAQTPVSIARLHKFGSLRPYFELSGKQPNSLFKRQLLFLGPYGANASLIMKHDFARSNRWDIDCDMADWKFALDNYPEKVYYQIEYPYHYRIHKNQISRNASINYEWLFSVWRFHFSKISEIDINQKIIQAIALPNKRTVLSMEDYALLSQVFQDLLASIGENSDFYFEFKYLLKRRLTLSIAYSKCPSAVRYFKDIFPAHEIVFDAFDFSAKLALNHDIARKI